LFPFLPHTSRVLHLALSVTLLFVFFLFVTQYLGNGFVPNSQGGRFWSLPSLKRI